MERMYAVVKRPLITEKATDATADRNAYTFRVPVDANKVEIRQSVEKLFGVRVLSVNTLRPPQKLRRRGWKAGATPQWKKAVVRLGEGQTIDIL